MRRFITILLSILLVFGAVLFTACGTGDPVETPKTSAGKTPEPTPEPTPTVKSYYVAGNFNGYVADDSDFKMELLNNNIYKVTVELTEGNRDKTYDGHFYKITDGTWTHSWGSAEYVLQPAPAAPSGGGMGSVYIADNQTLTIFFNSETKLVSDSSVTRPLANPTIYGDFSSEMGKTDWVVADGLVLTDADEDGTFTGTFTIPAYTDKGSGYSMAVAVVEAYYGEWNVWGVEEQYKFDGTAAKIGDLSYLKPAADTVYTFSYDSETHITTVTTAS